MSCLMMNMISDIRLHNPITLQEKRRAERAEQQRVRSEKDKERQARREVSGILFGAQYKYICIYMYMLGGLAKNPYHGI